MSLADQLIGGLISLLGRRTGWRIGRRLYFAARDEQGNAIDSNGEVDLMLAIARLSDSDRPLRVWDVGGNLGLWTDHMLSTAAAAGRRAAIEVFEPAPAAFTHLQEHFAGNPAVRVHQLALSSRTGTAKFELVGATAGTNSLSLSGSGSAQLIDVAVDTAAEWLKRSDGGDPDLVKIDAEGHDFDVLCGMEELLAAKRIGVVQFEYNWRWLIGGTSLRRVFALADRVHYRLGRMVRGRVEFYDGWNPELDRFIEANYILARADLASRIDHRVSGWDESNLPVELPKWK